MSTPAPPPDIWESIVEAEVSDLEVKTLNISTGAKISHKDHNGTIRSFDSSVSWTLVAPEGRTMSKETARRAGFRYMPRLVEKVITDLFVAGAMDEKEVVMRIREAQARYGVYSGERRPDHGDLHDTGAGASTPAPGSAGSPGAPGEATGGPPLAGHGDQPIYGGDAGVGGNQEGDSSAAGVGEPEYER